ncbi:MAG: SLC13 family permease [Gammaproteobacteria bacterium]
MHVDNSRLSLVLYLQIFRSTQIRKLASTDRRTPSLKGKAQPATFTDLLIPIFQSATLGDYYFGNISSMELSFHASATLILTIVALYFFSQDRYRLETSSLLILIALTLLFTLAPYTHEDGSSLKPADFFSGFGHEALIAICSLMILGKSIEATGALKPFGRKLSTYWKKKPKRIFLITLRAGAVLSGFLNNTPIVIMLIPILIGVALDTKTAASKILIPAGFATLIGGMATTIGTSTNLLIIAIAADISTIKFNMFDFTLPVVIVGAAGILFLWIAAPLLLPSRQIDLTNTSQRIYNAVLFLSDTSYTAGKDIRSILETINYEVSIHKIRRRKNQLILPLPTVLLKPDDVLFISGTAEKLKEFEYKLKGKLHNINQKEEFIKGEYKVQDDDQVISEVLVTSNSLLHNRSLKSTRLAEKYNVIVLALHRLNKPTERINEKLSKITLHQGDILLVQGKQEDIDLIKEDTKLLVLDSKIDYVSSRKGPLAIVIMAAVVIMAALNILPISVSALAGAGFSLLTRCIRWHDIGKALNPQVIMIVVVSLALGKALIDTGGTDFLAYHFVHITEGLSVVTILCALLFLMSFITNVVSNTAAAVVGTPVAVHIAQQLGAPIEPFILAVLFGVNMSYATPIGYQTNLLIYSAGGYKFTDFLRVGIPLTLITGIGFTSVLAYFYHLT